MDFESIDIAVQTGVSFGYDILTVYHGSENTIKQPVFGKGVPYNDYGRGFYMTKDKGLAGEWAVLTTAKTGYINEYRFDTSNFMVLCLDRLPIMYWVAILMDNRKGQYTDIVQQDIKNFKQRYLIDINEFDVIIGWRADDSYFQFVEDFVSRNLSIENLQKSMHFGNLGQQVCVKSERAFSRLEFTQSHKAELQRYYRNAVDRDNEARVVYRKLISSGKAREGTLISELMQEVQYASI